MRPVVHGGTVGVAWVQLRAVESRERLGYASAFVLPSTNKDHTAHAIDTVGILQATTVHRTTDSGQTQKKYSSSRSRRRAMRRARTHHSTPRSSRMLAASHDTRDSTAEHFIPNQPSHTHVSYMFRTVRIYNYTRSCTGTGTSTGQAPAPAPTVVPVDLCTCGCI